MKAVISSVYPYLFLFFCFILPLDKYATAAPNLILIAIIVLFPFVIKRRHLLKLKSIPFIILGSLILMVLFNSIIFNEFQEDIHKKKEYLQWIINNLTTGDIDVNIMTKLDKSNHLDGEVQPVEFNDAHAALRGFANSNLNRSHF